MDLDQGQFMILQQEDLQSIIEFENRWLGYIEFRKGGVLELAIVFYLRGSTQRETNHRITIGCRAGPYLHRAFKLMGSVRSVLITIIATVRIDRHESEPGDPLNVLGVTLSIFSTETK